LGTIGEERGKRREERGERREERGERREEREHAECPYLRPTAACVRYENLIVGPRALP